MIFTKPKIKFSSTFCYLFPPYTLFPHLLPFSPNFLFFVIFFLPFLLIFLYFHFLNIVSSIFLFSHIPLTPLIPLLYSCPLIFFLHALFPLLWSGENQKYIPLGWNRKCSNRHQQIFPFLPNDISSTLVAYNLITGFFRFNVILKLST